MTADWLVLLLLGAALVTGAAVRILWAGDPVLQRRLGRNPFWYWWPNPRHPRFWRSYLCARLGGLLMLVVLARWLAHPQLAVPAGAGP